ncbi:MAG TPA: hypothetical protein DEP80_05040, partial [Anaerolineae bacterium]|nr:hypothetical protein [Anaerolineae bacterium]
IMDVSRYIYLVTTQACHAEQSVLPRHLHAWASVRSEASHDQFQIVFHRPLSMVNRPFQCMDTGLPDVRSSGLQVPIFFGKTFLQVAGSRRGFVPRLLEKPTDNWQPATVP